MKLSKYIAALEVIKSAEGDIDVIAHTPGGSAISCGSGFDYVLASPPKIVRTGTLLGGSFAFYGGTGGRDIGSTGSAVSINPPMIFSFSVS